MRRFLSWALLAVCTLVAYAIMFLFWNLIFIIWATIASFSTLVFWIIIIFGGSVGLGLISVGVCMFPALTIMVSQHVWKSSKGLRYIVMGVLIILFFLASIVSSIITNIYILTTVMEILIYLSMVVYGIVLIVSGKSAAEEDGPPPTKKEKLEAQLASIEKSERGAQAAELLREANEKGISVDDIIAMKEKINNE